MELLRELFDRQKSILDVFFQSVDLIAASQVLDALAQCKGMVVLTGIGKSGLIAQKISATLVSTGTRSLFLHPSSALHGDIGVLTPDDIFIALSKSGQTQELIDLLPHVEKKGAKTVAVVSAKNSKIEKMSSLTVHLPVASELCPFDLAPTSSAAIQLIFGDILAIALMRKREFSVNDFAMNHPAGLLGRKISLHVSDLMFKGKEIPLCRPTDKLIDALYELSVKKCGCILIAEDDLMLQGIFTDGDFRRAMQTKGPLALESPLSELMTKHPKSIGPHHLAIDAVRVMEEERSRLITVLPVLDAGKIVGLIRMHDIIQSGLHG